MIAASGIFGYRNDDPRNLREYSNLFILDFDKFPDHQAVEAFKQRLIQYANQLHIYALWISPSNKGIKVAMLHDNRNPEYHYNLFWQIKLRLFPNTEEYYFLIPKSLTRNVTTSAVRVSCVMIRKCGLIPTRIT